MTTIYIDRQAYEINEGQNVLEACLSLGLNLPYFCWHPALGSVGACRQCAVKQFKDENDTRGKLVMACMTPAVPGLRISIADPEAAEFRASVIEWLMTNHPHDCPVCDEGGECHLQDMTVMTGHTYREYRFNKRTYRNQDLGPFLNHEMNRCIQCYRCVRFYRDYAGGRDFDAFAAHNHVYFGRSEDGALESEFSGNLVEVCPTGVFTDKTFKQHYTRKWDLQTAPSICVHCGLGCNTLPGERDGELRRIRNRYNGAVNGYFLCDRGRYGYEFVNSDQRLRAPLLAQVSEGDGSSPRTATSLDTAMRKIASILKDGAQAIGIGSPRASLEANFALRVLVGPDRFYAGLAAQDLHLITTVIDILRRGPARTPSLREIEQADAVLVLGEDLTNTAPLLALAVRQAIRRQPLKKAEQLRIPEWDDAAVREVTQDDTGPLFIAAPIETKLDAVATTTYRAAPDDLARLGFAIARALNDGAPEAAGLPADVWALARQIARALQSAERPVIISGTSCGNQGMLHAAANIAWSLPRAQLCFTVPECNSLGLGLMADRGLEAARRAVQSGAADTVIVLENDLYRRAAADTVDTLIHAARHVIALDYLTTDTTRQAEVALPVTTFAESTGTLVNNEGRVQRSYQVFVPAGDVQDGWCQLRDIMLALGRSESDTWHSVDDIDRALIEALPAFKAIVDLAPPADFGVDGQRIPRQSARYSGRTAINANVSVHEPQPPEDADAPLTFSMEGYAGSPPAQLISRFWAPGWNSVQALNRFQEEIGGPLRGGDPGRRLIEPAAIEQVAYFRDVPAEFTPHRDEWLIVPLYHIFGSEELSGFSAGIAERAPEPYVALPPADAEALHVQEGTLVELPIGGVARQLPVRLLPALPRGLIGLPVGLPESFFIVQPAWAHLTVPADERVRP